MKRKSITIYSVIISIVFAFAIGFFAFNIFSEIHTGTVRAKNTFDSLTAAIKKARTPEEIKAAVLYPENYAALFIADNGTPVVASPNENAKNAESTRLVKVYRVTVNRNETPCDITAAIYVLRPSVIFYYARFSFIIIMIATLLTIVLIIFISATSKNEFSDEPDEDDDYEEISQDEDSEQDYKFEEENSQEDYEFNSETTESEGENSGIILETHDDYAENSMQEATTVSEDETDTAADEIPYGKTAELREQEQEAEPDVSLFTLPEENEAKDKFSPVTGLSWETQLKPRLETELVRAASSEQDISLFLIKIPGLSFTDDETKEITAYLLKEMPFRDKLFEYNNDSFAMIRLETTIDEAEDYAEKLHCGIRELLPQEKNDCYIGISSRSTRMLSAERLITEADEALRHAVEEETSKIIGFHVDIEKYRQFIKNS